MSKANRKLHPRLWQPTYLLNHAMAKSIRQIVAGIMPEESNIALLDVGCGSMPYRELFEPLMGSYVGCDMYTDSDDVVACPADSLAFEDENFDVVVCFQVLEHVPNPWKVMAECARVLKPNGVLLLTAPFIFPFHASPNDFYRYTHEGLKELALQAGLDRVELKPQCLSLPTVFLLLNIMFSQVSGVARTMLLLRPIAWLSQWVLIPFFNLVGMGAELITPKKRALQFKGFPGYSNLAMIARKPERAAVSKTHLRKEP